MYNKLIFTDTTIGASGVVLDGNIYGGVSYECNINADENIMPGTVASAKVEFTTDV